MLLDEIDDDENLEEEPDIEHGDDDEPSLGSRPGMDQSQWALTDQGGFCIDAEMEADDEPTMGATENPPSLFFGGPHWHWHVDERCSQLNWAGTTGQPAPDECELDHDNEAEAGTRDLGQGWANNIDQTHLHMIIAEPETDASRPALHQNPNFPRGLSKGGKRVNLRALRRAKKAKMCP